MAKCPTENKFPGSNNKKIIITMLLLTEVLVAVRAFRPPRSPVQTGKPRPKKGKGPFRLPFCTHSVCSLPFGNQNPEPSLLPSSPWNPPAAAVGKSDSRRAEIQERENSHEVTSSAFYQAKYKASLNSRR